MILINKKVFAIIPFDDPVSIFMRQYDPDYIELVTEEFSKEAGKPQEYKLFSMSLETAEWAYKGTAQWVCPD